MEVDNNKQIDVDKLRYIETPISLGLTSPSHINGINQENIDRRGSQNIGSASPQNNSPVSPQNLQSASPQILGSTSPLQNYSVANPSQLTTKSVGWTQQPTDGHEVDTTKTSSKISQKMSPVC